jgi:thiamine kinase-like enzyme
MMDGTRGGIVSKQEERIRALPCWNGSIEISVLKGGISNESFLVTDASGRHVVRFGHDYPFHHVFRDRELMTARAAHAAGFAPEVRYAEPGVMVSAFLEAKTYGGADVVRERRRIAELLRRFHHDMSGHVSGAGFMFWVFHIIRDYARTLESGRSRMTGELPRYLALNAELEAVQVPLPIIFGHGDLLPSNFLDDGTRLWLIDFEYAGFGTAMFDLAGVTSNAGFSPDEAEEFLQAYFGSPTQPEMARAFAAMQCASLLREAMWSMVSELHLSAPGADYEAYTHHNLDRLEQALDHYRTRYGKNPSCPCHPTPRSSS